MTIMPMRPVATQTANRASTIAPQAIIGGEVVPDQLHARAHGRQRVDALVEQHRNREYADREGEGGEQPADARSDDQHCPAVRRAEQHADDVVEARERP